MLNQEFQQKMKQKLLEEKKMVEERIAKYEAPEKPMDNPDESDLAYDAEEDMLEEGLVEVHKSILNKINTALEKQEKGTYGICDQCGAEISAEELEQEPWAEHCLICNS